MLAGPLVLGQPMTARLTISLHSPNGRHLPPMQGDCQWALENNGNSHWSHDSTIH